MSIIKSFWFWLVIIGLLLILTAILIGGGMKEIKGWTWAIFIVGAVLGLLGIIFAIIAWSRYVPCKTSCSDMKSPHESSFSSPVYSSTNVSPSSLYSSPNISPYSSTNVSPLGTPTRVSVNLPQAKRGFSTTPFELSSLAPK